MLLAFLPFNTSCAYLSKKENNTREPCKEKINKKEKLNRNDKSTLLTQNHSSSSLKTPKILGRICTGCQHPYKKDTTKLSLSV